MWSGFVAYEIRLNGKVAGYCQNGSNPADYNFTKQVREGVNNLTIKVLSNPASAVLESWAHPSEPALGSCYVFSQPTIRIRDLFTKTYRNGSVFNGEVGIVVKTDALNPKKAKIHYELLTPQDEVVTYGSQEIELDMRRKIPCVWSPRFPIRWYGAPATRHSTPCGSRHRLKAVIRSTYRSRSASAPSATPGGSWRSTGIR